MGVGLSRSLKTGECNDDDDEEEEEEEAEAEEEEEEEAEGKEEGVVVDSSSSYPSPSFPHSLLPQEYIHPLKLISNECVLPHATVTTTLDGGRGVGRVNDCGGGIGRMVGLDRYVVMGRSFFVVVWGGEEEGGGGGCDDDDGDDEGEGGDDNDDDAG
jgi:hypothetical protein